LSRPSWVSLELCNHALYQLAEILGGKNNPPNANPLVEVFAFDQDFPFHSMMRQRMYRIHQAIPKPAHRA
jgi:hypothetical protein